MNLKNKSIVSIFAILSLLLAIPIIFWNCIRNSNILDFILNEWSTTPVELWESIITYLSMGFTLLLGVIVYYQSQKINALESSQYDIFIGIDRLDYSWDFKDALIGECNKEQEFSIVQSFSEGAHGYLTTLNVDINQDLKKKPLFIPLSFITKNCPLITSLDFQKISLSIVFEDDKIYQKEFYNSAKPIYTILCDGSRFSFGIGMMLSSNLEIAKVSLCIKFDISDQIQRIHSKTVSVDLEKVSDNFYLSSSNTV